MALELHSSCIKGHVLESDDKVSSSIYEVLSKRLEDCSLVKQDDLAG